MCAVVFIFAGLCGCGSNNSDGTNDKKADKGIESVMQAGPTTMDEWKIIMLDYESYFEHENINSQSSQSNACYVSMTNVTEDEFRSFIDEAAKIYSKDTYSNFTTDTDGKPLCGFYGDTPDGKYKLIAGLVYNEYIDEDSLICNISCEIQDDEETEE